MISVSFAVDISMFREWFHPSASGTALRFGRRLAPMCRGGLCVKHVDDEASENNRLCDEGFWEMRWRSGDIRQQEREKPSEAFEQE